MGRPLRAYDVRMRLSVGDVVVRTDARTQKRLVVERIASDSRIFVRPESGGRLFVVPFPMILRKVEDIPILSESDDAGTARIMPRFR